MALGHIYFNPLTPIRPVAHLHEPPESARLHVALFTTTWMLNDVMYRKSAHARITWTASFSVSRQNKPMLSLNFSLHKQRNKTKKLSFSFPTK